MPNTAAIVVDSEAIALARIAPLTKGAIADLAKKIPAEVASRAALVEREGSANAWRNA